MRPRLAAFLLPALALSCGLDALAFPQFARGPEIVEYYNEITQRYVLVADPAEGRAIERGAAGEGWRRSGQRLQESWDTFSSPNPPALWEVCRFYSPSSRSHFFTADPAECRYLRTHDTGWVFEKIAFHAARADPLYGGCETGRVPVYRLYNNRHGRHDAAHRFTPSAAVRAQLLAAGWIDEGVAFCPSDASMWPDHDLNLAYATVLPELPVLALAGCGAVSGPCVATGALAPVRTSSAAESSTIRGSFVQAAPQGGLPMTVHVDGRERLAGPWASLGPMYSLAGASEAPRPWPYRTESTLVVTAEVTAPEVRRDGPDGHAYAMPLLHIVDRVSGRSVYVTLQAFGTLPAVDFAARDATTGIPIVSTSFKARPAFGTRIAGEFVRCDPAASVACVPAKTRFQFAIGKADFARVLEMARKLDDSLSAAPGDYALAGLRFHVETYLDARLAATLHVFAVGLFPTTFEPGSR